VKPRQLIPIDIACNGSVVNPDSGALEVGDHATSNTHDVIRICTEVVIPCSRSSPHLVVLQQVRINEHTQLCAVTKGRHAIIGFGNSTQIVSVICIELDFDDVSAGICEFPSKFSV